MEMGRVRSATKRLSRIDGAVLKKHALERLCLFLRHDLRISYPPIANRCRHVIGPLRAASAIRRGIREDIRTNRLRNYTLVLIIAQTFLITYYIWQEGSIKLLIKMNG